MQCEPKSCSNIVYYNEEIITSKYTFGCTKLKGTEEKSLPPFWETLLGNEAIHMLFFW